MDLANCSRSPYCKCSSLYPTVHNSYVILGEILSNAEWLLSWKLRMYSFAYHWLRNPKTFFAFKWKVPGETHQQMIWTVLPQVFRDSAHFFGQSLIQDLLDMNLRLNGKIFQYLDDLLIYSIDEAAGYTKTGLNPSTWFEVAKLRENIPSICP